MIFLISTCKNSPDIADAKQLIPPEQSATVPWSQLLKRHKSNHPMQRWIDLCQGVSGAKPMSR